MRSSQRFLLLSSAVALLLTGTAFAQEKLEGKAKFCDDFDQDVIIAGKLDLAPKYLTEDFKEHNLRLAANGLADFTEKMKAIRAAAAAKGGGRGRGGAPRARTVVTDGDLVMFYSVIPERDDPNNPGKKLPAGTHFDVYKLRGGKIAEHWD
jgi:predicted SnoaL-like aldol condensation-catalyzing enzyme